MSKSLTALTSATTPLAGTEEVYVVQGGNSRKATAGNFYIPGGTDVAVTDGGTGASTASAARSNLGLVIGTDVQAHDADLDAIAALSTTSYGRSLLTSASAIALANSLGVIPDAIVTYAADGGGVVNNVTPFTNAGAAGKLTFIPKPSAHYEFTTTLNGYDIGGAWLPDPAMTWAALTDTGQFNMYRGRFTGTGANIWRLSDRIFVGEAASKFAGDVNSADGGNSWVKNQTDCPWYLPLNAGVLWTSGGNATTSANPPYGFVSGVKTSTLGQAGIGFGSLVVADQASANAWGYIAEIQREAGTNSVYAFEIDVKNKGANATITPNAQVVGTYGLWVVAGGDVSFGGSPTNPSTAAMVVLKNAHTWNSGIVFMKDALTAGEAMALSSEGVGGAHKLAWYNAAGNQVFNVLSGATDAVSWNLNRINGSLQIAVGGTQAFAFSSASAPANALTFSSAATTVAPSVAATGSDTNIDLALIPKGTGSVIPTTNDAAALGTATKSWSDLFLASGGVLNWNNGDVTATHSANLLAFGGASSGYTFDAAVTPSSNDAAALGSATVSWSDAFLASGAVLNFNNGNYTVTHSAGVLTFSGTVLSSGTGGIGYATGAGAGNSVTQLTSRTTGVTINKPTGAITMFSAAGSATAATFTVTNSSVAATDTIILNQKSGTNLYNFIVTTVAAGSFNITFFTTGGTATDAPVINFSVIKGSAN